MAADHPNSSNNLPSELITDILLRLPVKTLIRCTSVSKHWYSLIRNPNFVNSHFISNNNNNINNNQYILIGNTNTCHVICNKTFQLIYTVNIQTLFNISPNRKHSLNFIGSVNGLLCLAPGLEYNLGNDVYIWNPSVGVYKKLPVSRFSDEFTNEFTNDRWIVSRLGFGFHESDNDYKVIRLIYFPESSSFPFVDVAPLVEVYSLRADSWEVVCSEVPPVMIQSVAVFNGAVFYWMGFKGVRDDPMENYILSYDLDDGRFREIEQPSVDFPFSLLAVRGLSGELFAVYSKFFGGQNDVLVLWKMDGVNNGWVKAYTIQCNRGVWATLGFSRSGKFLFANLEKKLVSFDLESLETEVHDLGIAFNRSAVDVDYMESLLFFDH